MNRAIARPLDISRSSPYFLTLLVTALVAFWPSYLSQLVVSSAYIHLHALAATLWLLLLIAQPLAVRRRRMQLHRSLGKASFVLAPLIVLSVVLLAHSHIKGLVGEAYGIQTYTLYLQMSLGALFALCYALAIWERRNTAVHSRLMVCTGLTLIDPIVIRLMFWVDRTPDWNYQWFTFGLTDFVLVALIWLERRSLTGRAVFPVMLVVFAASQAPALFGLTASPGWQSFARWFADLPLT